jgi:hypothetical protein
LEATTLADLSGTGARRRSSPIQTTSSEGTHQ